MDKLDMTIEPQNLPYAEEAVGTDLEQPPVLDDIPEQYLDQVPLKRKRNWKKIIKRLIIAVILIAIAAVAVYIYNMFKQPDTSSASEYIQETVSKRDIVVSLSGSGTLQPADSYTVSGLVSGEIMEADFEEGDYIEKDTVLYRIDTKDADDNVKTQEDNLESAVISLERAQTSYQQALEDKAEYETNRSKDRDKLYLYAKDAGQVTEVYFEVGDTIGAGQVIADIVDNTTLELTLPFLTDDAETLYIGQSAQITITDTGEALSGRVTKVASYTTVAATGVEVRDVTISVSNPSGLYEGVLATAIVGNVACNDSGSFSYLTNTTITSTQGGEISALYIDEGSKVSVGQTVLTLVESDASTSYARQVESALNSISDAERTIEQRQDSLERSIENLDDYVLTAPISGTVVEKTYKKGDKVSLTGAGDSSMAIIYDLSSLYFEISVDELDISKIEVGQSVTVTADAVEGKTYEGVVTKMSVKGNTSNGVTSYPVKVEITETDGLLPGMNVEAEILVRQKLDVIAVPTSALQRGNRILVQTGAAPAVSSAPDNADTDVPSDRQLPSDGQITQGASTTGEVTVVTAGSVIPEGFEYIVVEVGDTDGDYIEIVSGLSVGDVIAYMPAVSTETTFNGMFMTSGGMDGGNMSGGPPSDGGGGGTMIVTR